MLQRLRGRTFLTPVLIAACSLVISATLSLLAPTLPVPGVHDEFSYLLAGDTFSHGRLTNSPHPLWPFFETFQVLSQPTYMSKYPPAEGTFLALGILVAREPILGVWISTALACAAAWWALAGIMPRRWATIGALVMAIHPVLLQWNWSYWGGAPAMIGGCLVVGAIARLAKRRGRVFDGAMLGLGIGILLNSRPFEGAVLTLLCLAIFLGRIARGPGLKSIAIGALPVLGLIVGWTAYYNYRVTGSAMQFPYTLYEKQYAVTSPLIWLPPPARTPEYRLEQMREYYHDWELKRYEEQRTARGLVRETAFKFWTFVKAYFISTPAMILPAVAALWALARDRKLRPMAILLLLMLLAGFSGIWFFSHYFAPAVILYLIVLIQGLRHLRAWRPRGIWIVRAVLLLHIAAAVVFCWTNILPPPTEGWAPKRASILQDMLRDGGKHLVIVHRQPGASYHFEWVYNAADIDASPVVWAHDLGAAENRALLDYYRDRTVWLLDVGADSISLNPYR
ncbi:MAG TPA: hypothetical protein VH518_16635 [Tepidisphaeraceae bacterium]|jgi:hypothetical protein